MTFLLLELTLIFITTIANIIASGNTNVVINISERLRLEDSKGFSSL